MDIKDALSYIDSLENFGSRPGLERVRALLDKLGNPQEQLRFVHIAGTNGKGSCAAMLSSILRAAGYKTGLFTSPHLLRYHERFQINGEAISDADLAALTGELRPLAERMEDHPTAFEFLTALGLCYFQRQGCDLVVLEVGLGGRLDATNVIGVPEVAVIMNIGLDHTAVLGDTVEQIAREKAGIIKAGGAVALYPQETGAAQVLRQICRERGVRLREVDPGALTAEFESPEGQVFRYRGESYALALLGRHQLCNAATALEAVALLRERGWKLPREAVEHGLYAASWPGRFELLQEEPPVVADGGHNPQCAQAVAQSLQLYFPRHPRILLLGILADKDYEQIVRILDPVADGYVCLAPDSPRALSAEALGALLQSYGKPVTVCHSIEEALSAALDAAGEEGMVCATGSLYLIGKLRALLGLR